MSSSASTGAQQRISGYGVGAPSIKLYAPPLISPNAPTTSQYRYPLGQIWVDTTSQAVYILVSNAGNSATWALFAGSSSEVNTINNLPPTAGNITITGTANQILASNAGSTVTLSLIGPYTPATYTAHGVLLGEGTGSIVATAAGATGQTLMGSAGADPGWTGSPSFSGSVTAATTITATLGNITATDGNFVASAAGTGLVVPVATGSGAASGTVTCNGRQGSVSFTSPSIAGGATATVTMGNTSITGSSTLILYSISGATTGSALSIQSITNSAGSSAVVLTNGTGATTQTGTITLNFIILN